VSRRLKTMFDPALARALLEPRPALHRDEGTLLPATAQVGRTTNG
jgi:hypothetical protein